MLFIYRSKYVTQRIMTAAFAQAGLRCGPRGRRSAVCRTAATVDAKLNIFMLLLFCPFGKISC
jgi:hypothetical protein